MPWSMLSRPTGRNGSCALSVRVTAVAHRTNYITAMAEDGRERPAALTTSTQPVAPHQSSFAMARGALCDGGAAGQLYCAILTAGISRQPSACLT